MRCRLSPSFSSLNHLNAKIRPQKRQYKVTVRIQTRSELESGSGLTQSERQRSVQVFVPEQLAKKQSAVLSERTPEILLRVGHAEPVLKESVSIEGFVSAWERPGLGLCSDTDESNSGVRLLPLRFDYFFSGIGFCTRSGVEQCVEAAHSTDRFCRPKRPKKLSLDNTVDKLQ